MVGLGLGLGSLIGGALGLASTIYGSVQSNKAMQGVKADTENRLAENEAWYNRRYNEDATQRADAQRILQITQENIKNRNKQAAGRAAVMGGTDEGVAAAKAANNEALASAAAEIAAAGDKRKDAIEREYKGTKDALRDNLNAMEVNRANNIASAAASSAGVFGNLGSSIDYLRDLNEEEE